MGTALAVQALAPLQLERSPNECRPAGKGAVFRGRMLVATWPANPEPAETSVPTSA
jgi:hypothetical protein